ncbi:MAG: hypothetical protein JJ863_09190 [Deltaproteobacteria bacterium]|nr:hypothetical protein [Deltaproteobacteria bacterium]
MTPDDQKRFVQIVGQVLISDGILGDAERDHLDRVMDELGLQGDARKEALRGIDVDSPVEERVQALSDEARGQLLAAVERAAAVDGEAQKAETQLVEQLRNLLNA